MCLAFAVTLLGVTRCLLFKISCESRLIFRPVLSLVLTHLIARSDAHIRVAHSHTAFGTRCLTIFPQSPSPPLLSCSRVYCALLVFDVFTRLRDLIGPSSPITATSLSPLSLPSSPHTAGGLGHIVQHFFCHPNPEWKTHHEST